MTETRLPTVEEINKALLAHYLELDSEGNFVNPPSTDEQLREFIELAYGCTFTDKVVIPGHSTPWRFLSDLFFQRVRNALGFANRSSGKALSLTTPLLTKNRGWITMGEVRVGDFVYSADGTPTKVDYVGPIYTDHDCFEVEFATGEVITADAEHLWYTNRAKQPQRLWTTREMFDVLQSPPRIGYGVLFWMDLASPLVGETKALPIPPYVLGAWLGDGGSSSNLVFSWDVEIRNRLISEWHGAFDCSNSKDKKVALPGLKKALRSAGLLEVRRENRCRSPYFIKRVPEAYLTASIEQRWELLRGLMDTDGWAERNKDYVFFSNTNKELIEQVAFLMRSLGLRPVIWDKGPGKCMYKGRMSVGANAWTIAVRVGDTNPFWLPRKASIIGELRARRSNAPRSMRHRVMSIRKCSSVPVRCIRVEHPSHLFLCGKSLIPTHNTYTTAILNHLDMMFKPGCEIAHAGAIRTQADQSYKYFTGFLELPWMHDLNSAYREITGRKFVDKTLMGKTTFGNGSSLTIITASEKGLRSPHPHKVRLDEVDLIDWEQIQTGLSMTHSSKGIMAQNVFTSTRQLQHGTMQRMLDMAAEKGITVYEWNIWESVQKCNRRCENDPTHGTCPIYTFCKGKAHSSGGFYKIGDFIDKVKLIDREKFETEWENKRPARSKLVFSMFDNTRHVMDEAKLKALTGFTTIQPEWQRVSGLDFGSSPGHPFVYLKFARLPNGAWLLFHEYVASQRLLRDHAAAIKSSPGWTPTELIFADWQGRQDRVELQALGIRTKEANKDVLLGLDYLQELMRGYPPREEPMFYVWHTCKSTLDQFGKYSYYSDEGGAIHKDAPIKMHDDVADASRYALFSLKTRSSGPRYRTFTVPGL